MNTCLFITRITSTSASFLKSRHVWHVWPALALAVLWATTLGVQAAADTWTGTASTAWATGGVGGNWNGGSVPATTDNILVGTATTVINSTIDLGGSASISLTAGAITVATTTTPATSQTYALEFGPTGGTSYTMQNGSLTILTSSSTYNAFLKVGAGVTLNYNLNNSDTLQRVIELRNGSTLNIGSGVTAATGRLVFFAGNAGAGNAETVNINAVSYSDGSRWLIGSGNASTSSSTSTEQNLTVNFNANQSLTADLLLGWTTASSTNTVVIRNGATVTSSANFDVGYTLATAVGASNGRLLLGDATTTGNLTLTSTSAGGLVLGSSGTGPTASAGMVDVVNGTLTLAGATSGAGTNVALGFSGQANDKGVINLYTNGVMDTARNFTLASSTAGNGVINFNGGKLKVNSAIGSTPSGNLIDPAVTVNVLDGGATFDVNGKTATINAALLNGGTGVGVVTLTNSSSTAGKVTFNGASTYQGATVIKTNTTLALGASGSLNANSSVGIMAGATFDVAALTTSSATYAWNTARLSASGTGTTAGTTAATVTGTAGGTISMGAKPITLTWSGAASGTDSTHPPLKVSTANLSLGGNQFTVVVPGTALGVGTYTLVSATAISGGSTVNSAPLYTGGNGVASGLTGVVSISGNNVILTVSYSTSTTGSTLDMSLPSCWIGGVVPGASDIAYFTVAGTYTNSSGPFSFLGISANASGVIISPIITTTINLGTSGLSGSQDLNFLGNTDGKTTLNVGANNQTWSIASANTGAKITGSATIHLTGANATWLRGDNTGFTGTWLVDGSIFYPAADIGLGASTVTIQLTNNGALRFAGNLGNYTRGTIQMIGSGRLLGPAGGAIGVSTNSQSVSGAGNLTISSINATTATTNNLNGNYTLTGNLLMDGITYSNYVNFCSASTNTFTIGANGVNNKIASSGAGTLAQRILNLNGTFKFDVSGANTTAGNSWTIVDVANLTTTYGANFNVSGFTGSAGVWTMVSGGKAWYYTQSSGVLAVSNALAVSFTSNGGSAVTSQSVAYGTTATQPANPTKTGYTFAGWYADAGLATAFNFSTAITADTTLYAKWNVAAVAFNLLSSSQTNGYHDSVFFTATNLPAGAASNVVFAANGVPFSTNNVNNGGATSLSLTNLPRGGTNIILATYNGDGTYPSASTNLIQTVTNHVPAAATMTVTRTAGLALLISLSDVATNWTDNPDGDHVSLTGVTMQSTNGVNLFALNWSTNLDGSIVTTNGYAYIGYTNSPNVADQISYSISDGQGGTNIGYVDIVIQSSVTGTNSITAHDFTSPYSNTITAYGIPTFYYVLERATNLTSPVWVDVQTNQAATNGVINAADTFWDLGGVKPSPSAFYQLKWQP